MKRILPVIIALCLLLSGCSLGGILEDVMTPELLMEIAQARLDALDNISVHSSTVCDYSENGKRTYRAIDLDGSVLFDEQRMYASMHNELGSVEETEQVYMDMANDDFVAYYNIDDTWYKSDYLPCDLRLDMNILCSIRSDFNYIFSLMKKDKNLELGHYDFNGSTYYMLKTKIKPSFDDVEKLNLNSFAEYMGGVYYGTYDSFKDFWQKGSELDIRVYFDMETLIPYACLINLAPFTEQAYKALGRNVEAHEIYMSTIFDNCNTAEVNIPQAAKDAPSDTLTLRISPASDPAFAKEVQEYKELLDLLSSGYLKEHPSHTVVFSVLGSDLIMDVYTEYIEASAELKAFMQKTMNETYPDAEDSFASFKEFLPSINSFTTNMVTAAGDIVCSYRFQY